MRGVAETGRDDSFEKVILVEKQNKEDERQKYLLNFSVGELCMTFVGAVRVEQRGQRASAYGFSSELEGRW